MTKKVTTVFITKTRMKVKVKFIFVLIISGYMLKKNKPTVVDKMQIIITMVNLLFQSHK